MKQLYFIIFMIGCLPSIGQQAISGHIQELESEAPLPYANIFYKNSQHIGTMSAPSGAFILRHISTAAQDTLFISMLGYQTYYIPIVHIN